MDGSSEGFLRMGGDMDTFVGSRELVSKQEAIGNCERVGLINRRQSAGEDGMEWDHVFL